MKTVFVLLFGSVMCCTMGERVRKSKDENCQNSEGNGLYSVVSAGNIVCIIQRGPRDFHTLDENIGFKVTKIITYAKLLIQCGTKKHATFTRALFVSNKPRCNLEVNLLTNEIKSYVTLVTGADHRVVDVTYIPSINRFLVVTALRILSYPLQSFRHKTWKRLKRVSFLECDDTNKFVFAFQNKRMLPFSLEGGSMRNLCYVINIIRSVAVDAVIRRIYVGTDKGVLQMPYLCKSGDYLSSPLFEKGVYAITIDSMNGILYFITKSMLTGINLKQNFATVLNRTLESDFHKLGTMDMFHNNERLYIVNNNNLRIVKNDAFYQMTRLDGVVAICLLP